MFKTIVTIGFIHVLAILGNFIRSKTIAVLLGPAGVGVISNVDQVVQFVSYASACSIPVAAVKYLSKSHSEGSDVFQRTYAALLNTLVVLGVGGALVAIGMLLTTPGVYGAELIPYRTYLLLALPAVPAMSMGGYLVNVFAAAQKPTASSMLVIVTSIVLTVSTCIGIFAGSIAGMYAANTLAQLLLMIGTVLYLRRAFSLHPLDREASIVAEIRRAPSILVFAATLYVSTFAGSFSLVVARRAVLASYGAVEAGLLQSAIAIGLALSMVLNPTNALFLMPMVNRNMAKEEKLHAATEYQKRLLVMLGLATLPIVLFPRLVLTVLYSSRFLGASGYLFYFVLAQCLTLLAGVYSVLIIGFDDIEMNVAINTAGALLMALVSWAFVPKFGIMAVAAGFLIQGAFLFFFSWAWLAKRHAFRLPRELGMLMLYALTALIVAHVAARAHDEWTLGAVVIKALAAIAFGVGLLAFLTAHERSMLRERIARYL
ncbi:MAG TPA: oligosaccharide flippase family protein [Gemmatimonadaceae bacterium]